jgi:hypothetical protein
MKGLDLMEQEAINYLNENILVVDDETEYG